MTDFNAWSESALWTLLEVTVQAGLCVLVILGLQRALGKHLRPNWRHALWGLLLIRLLLPFSYDFTLIAPAFPAEPAPPLAPVSYTMTSPAITISNPPADTNPSSDAGGPILTADTIALSPAPQGPPQAPAKQTPFPIAAMLFALWCAGAVAVLAFVIVRHLRLMRAIERDALPAPDEVSHLLRRVRDELGLSIWPVVLVSPSIAAPLVVGALRPRILLPKTFTESASPADLRHVLMHELIHIRRRDLALAWLWLLALALHWFNPLIWWAGARMRRDREQACDQRVLAALPEPERIAYGHTLLKAVAAVNANSPLTRFAGAAAIVEDRASLEHRLTLIKTYTPTRPLQRMLGAVATLAIGTAAFVQLWGAAQAQQPEPAQENSAPVQTTPAVIPLPELASITDEAELVRIRDEQASAGNLFGACEAEFRRVMLRKQQGHAYADKIDFTDAYRKMPPMRTEKDYQDRFGAIFSEFPTRSSRDYTWRALHLLSTINGDYATIAPAEERAERLSTQRSLLGEAIRTYPRIKYNDPSRHSKLQHMVNELAMLIWDQDGVDAAEQFVVETWKTNRFFVSFFDPPWTARYKVESLPDTRLEALITAMGEKPAPIEITIMVTPEGMRYMKKAATWEEIESFVEEIHDPYNFYVALGYTTDEMPLKVWRDAKMRCIDLVTRFEFAYFSDIGEQTALTY